MKKMNLIFAGICSVIGILLIVLAAGYPTAADYGTGVPGPGLWPIVISAFMLALAALLVMKDIKAFKKLLDYREIGGTQFLGIKKPVIKAHGSSDARAFYSAVRQAMDAAKNNTAEELEIALKQIAAAKEKA